MPDDQLPDGEKQVLAVWRRQLRAMDEGDAEALGACFAPGAVLTHMTGYRQPLGEWLAGVRSRQFVYHRVEERSVEILRLEDGRATLVGQVVTGITDDGSGQAWPMRIDQDYERRDGSWACTRSRVALG